MYMHKWNAESPKKGQQRSTLKVNESATLVYLCFVHGFMYRNTLIIIFFFYLFPITVQDSNKPKKFANI